MDTFEVLLPYLNQARRKGSLAVGQEAVKRCLARRKCRLLLFATDAGGSLKRLESGAVPVLEAGDRRRLGAWLGRDEVAVLAVNDADLAAGILQRLGSD